MKRVIALLPLLFCLAASALTPEPGPHPRLLLKAGEEEAVRKTIASERIFAEADSVIMAFADRTLSQPVLTRTLVGRRMLGTSREAIKRIFWLSYAYRVHGGQQYCDRAIAEILNVCTFINWNPSHFLDTGEMAMAVGIGYDWLYDSLTSEQRSFICSAMLSKAFTPAKDEEGVAWFYSSPINWNQVCNAGLLYGALAIYDEEPFEAAHIVKRCLETNPLSLDAYSPEGGYPEGYNYWGYGTSFEIMLVAALESAFGSDCGLLDGNRGFLESAGFMEMMTTPLRRCYSFYDAYPAGAAQYMQAWMAARTNNPSILYPEVISMRLADFRNLCEDRLFPAFLIFGSRLDLSRLSVPKDHLYLCSGTTPVFLYRSGWDSPSDTYLGVKGGRASSSHAHSDIGSFYFEQDGVCWAADLGMQNYNSLEQRGLDIWNTKQESVRFDVFRIGPFSHNIPTVNGLKPDVNVSVPISRTWPRMEGGTRADVPDGPIGAELDLSPYLSGGLDSCVRRVLLEGRDLIVRDRYAAGEKEAAIRWQLCTEAAVEILDGQHIRLSKDGQTRILSAEVSDCGEQPLVEAWTAPASFEDSTDSDADHLHDYDAPNPGKTMTGFTLRLPSGGSATLTVRLGAIRYIIE